MKNLLLLLTLLFFSAGLYSQQPCEKDSIGVIEEMAQGIKVTFEDSGNSKYAFDAANSNNTTYPDYILRDGYKLLSSDYYVPYKAVLDGATDELIARVQITEASVSTDSLIFKTADGIKIEAEKMTGDSYRLTVRGRYSDSEEEVQAVIRQDGKYKVAGAFELIHFSEKEPAKVILVNMGAEPPERTGLENYLNGIYNRTGGYFSVVGTISIDPNLIAGNSIQSEKTGLLSQYTDDQKKINNVLKARADFDVNAYYMILTGKTASSGEKGFMPLGSQFGYIFEVQQTTVNRTIAHELGHGVFSLKHPGATDAAPPEGRTDLLMDYGNGTKLARRDWKAIQNPQLRIGWFDKREEGMSDYVKDASQFLKWLKDNIGKKNVSYNKNTFYAGGSWMDVPVKDENLKVTFYVEFENSGTVDFSLGQTGANYGVSFDLKNKYHNGFYLKFYYSDKPEKEAITIWFYSYENFGKFYEYLGLSLSQATKDKITSSYKQVINAAKSDCNKLDVIYETIPDFVISEMPSETLYAGIESLLGCDISHLPVKILLGEMFDTDEEKALLNLLSGIDKAWLYKKINSTPNLIEDFIINKMGVRYEKEFLKIISEIAEANWKQSDYENSNYYTLGSIALNFGDAGNGKERRTGCLNLGKLGEYKFGTQLQTSDDGILYSDYGGCKDMFETQSLTAILIEMENGESGVLPALVVKYLSKLMINRNKTNFINLSVSLMLPELFISKANGLKVFGKGGGTVGENELLSFMNKTLSQKLDEIAMIWKTKYPLPDMFEGRTFFEQVMREYRYTKATGWEYTADIASNFKGVDFYKGVTQGDRIYAETAVSMKTTITKDVNTWLNSKPIQDNLRFLREGFTKQGLESNSKIMLFEKAEIHIYMPKENITPALNIEWMNKLNTVDSKIKFEIKSVEEFIK